MQKLQEVSLCIATLFLRQDVQARDLHDLATNSSRLLMGTNEVVGACQYEPWAPASLYTIALFVVAQSLRSGGMPCSQGDFSRLEHLSEG